MNTYSGIVQKGRNRGRELGYPTVNIMQDDPSISGVFAAIVRIEKTMYHAAAFADSSRQILEAHVFGFDEEMYGRQLSIELVQKIRDTRRFDDDASLRVAIGEDIEQVKKYFDK